MPLCQHRTVPTPRQRRLRPPGLLAVLLAVLACGGLFLPGHLAPVHAQTVLAQADEAVRPGGAVGPVTGRPLPRFASLGSGRVNARTGPGVEYPIRWVYQRQYLPVLIVAESQNWRKIRDRDGDESWVHHALLSGRRTFLVKDRTATLLGEPNEAAPPILRAEAGVMGELEGCDDRWCRVVIAGRRGYLPRERVWGIGEDE